MESLASAIAGNATGSELTGEGARSMPPSPKIITNGRKGVPGTAAQRRRLPRQCRCQRSKSTHPQQSLAGREGKRPPGTTKGTRVQRHSEESSLDSPLKMRSFGPTEKGPRSYSSCTESPARQPTASHMGRHLWRRRSREEELLRGRRLRTGTTAGKPGAPRAELPGPDTGPQPAGSRLRNGDTGRRLCRTPRTRHPSRQGQSDVDVVDDKVAHRADGSMPMSR